MENGNDKWERVKESLENSPDSFIASMGDLLWTIDKERVGNAWVSFAKSNLASEGKDAHEILTLHLMITIEQQQEGTDGDQEE